MNVVITGTSRGIGLELTQLALSAGHRVMAVARSPEKSKDLLRLKHEFKDKLELITGDMTSEDTAPTVAAMVKDWGAVDVLVNNAGIYRMKTTRGEFIESFLVNTIAPFEMTQALLPYLKTSKSPKVIQITSLMGSIDDNTSGGYYAYRSSKAALNMINKSLAIDYPWLTAIVMHPGWVKTDMGGQQAPTPVRESASGIWKVIDGAKLEDSGRFFDFRGKQLKW